MERLRYQLHLHCTSGHMAQSLKQNKHLAQNFSIDMIFTNTNVMIPYAPKLICH